MSKKDFLNTMFFTSLFFILCSFCGEIGLIFYITIVAMFFLLYPMYIFINLIQIKIRKTSFNKRLLFIPLSICIFHFFLCWYIFQKWSHIDLSVKKDLYSKYYCERPNNFKLTRSYHGVSRDYKFVFKEDCVTIKSPSYSFSKVEYTYCSCDHNKSSMTN